MPISFVYNDKSECNLKEATLAALIGHLVFEDMFINKPYAGASSDKIFSQVDFLTRLHLGYKVIFCLVILYFGKVFLA